MNLLKIVITISVIMSIGVCHVCLKPEQHNMAVLDPRKESYCGSAIKWSISPATLDAHKDYDTNALAQYQEVYLRWQESGGSNNKDPTNDCLGVLRNILCAYNYPICSETEGDRVRVCNWYCDYLKDRCSQETDLYDLVCKGSADTDCANSSFLSLNLILSFISLSLLFL